MSTPQDPYKLDRFLDAQAGVYDDVLAELTAGRKRSHWVWYIFPQIAGLGSSPIARLYAIGSLAEATAYLDHPLLSERLQQCTALVNAVTDRDLTAILGYPDDLKFHSCMTLFAQAAPRSLAQPTIFAAALMQWFDGAPDSATLSLL